MKIARLTATIALLWIGAGCSSVTPASFAAEAPTIATKWSGAVSVSPAHTGDPASRFNASGMVFEANLDEFSDNLANLVRTSLRESGLEIESGGKEIEVEVVYLDFMFQGPCLLDYTVELGHSETFGLQSSGESANFQSACRSALESAVMQLLNDSRTRGYMRSE